MGHVSGRPVSTPVVSNRGQWVDGRFYDGWGTQSGRTFQVDMAGFAFWLSHFRRHCPGLRFPFKPGLLEDEFLKGLNLPLNQFQMLAQNCTKVQTVEHPPVFVIHRPSILHYFQIYVWHTKSKQPSFHRFEPLTDSEKKTNLGKLIPDEVT